MPSPLDYQSRRPESQGPTGRWVLLVLVIIASGILLAWLILLGLGATHWPFRR